MNSSYRMFKCNNCNRNTTVKIDVDLDICYDCQKLTLSGKCDNLNQIFKFTPEQLENLKSDAERVIGDMGLYGWDEYDKNDIEIPKKIIKNLEAENEIGFPEF